MPALPLGVIALWNGSIATIPAGWALCDGTLGTPDLRDRFLQGAGGALSPGDTGGSILHNHDFTSDLHNHVIPAGTDIVGGANLSSTTTSVVVTGTTNNALSRPPFHVLAYIMRV